MPIAAGVRLEHNEILATLGAGGMGEVYRARDTRLNREVAIKILSASFTHDADQLRRFEQEALLLKLDYTKIPADWLRDGRFIIHSQIDPKSKADVWVLPVTRSGEAKPFPVVPLEANETAGRSRPTDNGWPMPRIYRAGLRSTCRSSLGTVAMRRDDSVEGIEIR